MTRHRIMMTAIALTLAGAATAQQALPPVTETKNALPADADAASIVAVKADIAGRIAGWGGVRSCGRAERAQAAYQAAFDAWIGQQTVAHPGKILIDYGATARTWTYENKRRPSGARYCKGYFRTAEVFARYY